MSEAEPRLAIEVKGLNLKAGEKSLLEDASFSVHEGEMALLLGMSGSGKSLTLRLLGGLLEPGGPIEATGKVELFGEPPAKAARRRIGLVFQDYGLFDEWSTRENILFGHDHRRGRRNRPGLRPRLPRRWRRRRLARCRPGSSGNRGGRSGRSRRPVRRDR